ncbi:hypothetical protein MKY63_23830 [Paenibacillus sp. FSL R7-0189]|uniref:hypothetical protein n=1 Tax=Paenibacillus sp. FSL R7-0189 TaxID=2921673 RepID=UPI0030DC3AE4
MNRCLWSSESGLVKIEDTTSPFGLYRSYLEFLEHYSEVSDHIALIAKFFAPEKSTFGRIAASESNSMAKWAKSAK